MTDDVAAASAEDRLIEHRNAYEATVAARLAAPLNRPNGAPLLIGGTIALVLESYSL